MMGYMPGGRPIEPVPQAVADEIVNWVAAGKTIRAFCRQPNKPSRQTIDLWRDKDAEFDSRIARARESGHDEIADECLEIIDTATDANLGKARVWARLQLLAKWNPRKYGDKSHVELGGKDGAPIESNIVISFVKARESE